MSSYYRHGLFKQTGMLSFVHNDHSSYDDNDDDSQDTSYHRLDHSRPK